MELRTPYNYDRNAVSIATGLECTDPTRTQQQFKDDADINVIMRRFAVTGQLPQGVRMPQYGDFIDAVDDYQTAMNAIRAAEESFMMMPATVRDRFSNNPQRFLEFCEDPRNADEAKKLGLTKKPLPPENPNTGTTPATSEQPKDTP